MDIPSPEAPKLQCPTCGYDLHGLEPDCDGLFRCPECAGLTDVMSIVRVHQRRIRGERHLWIGMLAFLSLFAILTLAPSSWFRVDSTFVIRLAVGFVASILYVARFAGFAWPAKLIASGVLSLLIALPRGLKPEWGCWLYPIFPAALVAMHIWNADREMKRWSK